MENPWIDSRDELPPCDGTYEGTFSSIVPDTYPLCIFIFRYDGWDWYNHLGI